MFTDKNKDKSTPRLDVRMDEAVTTTTVPHLEQTFADNDFIPIDAGLTIPESDVPLEDEIDRLALALSLKFEELTLIHQFSERLKMGEDSADICQSLLEELDPCINASTIAIDLYRDDEFQCEGKFLFTGERWDEAWIGEVASHATSVAGGDNCSVGNAPVAILNSPSDDSPAFVRSVVIPIQRDGRSLGRMIAIRPIQDDEFGTVEADLMKSTSMILAAHLVNQRQYMEIQQMFEGMIQSLASALDAKDSYTSGHSSRVADMAVLIAEKLGFDQNGISRIRMAGILHDIGKIGIDDSVLRKTGQLTKDEFDHIKEHPVLGYEILKGIKPFREILPAVRHHHESWNGKGYPDGLAGDGIPRDAQVLAVADAFDAMSSDRPYRHGIKAGKVLDILRDGRGKQWAADVVDVLLQNPEITQGRSATVDTEA